MYCTEVLMGFAKLAVLFHRADCIANTLKKCIKRSQWKLSTLQTVTVKWQKDAITDRENGTFITEKYKQGYTP